MQLGRITITPPADRAPVLNAVPYELESVLGASLAERMGRDPAIEDLAALIQARREAGIDVVAQVRAAAADPGLPSLDEAQHPARALAWRLQRTGPSITAGRPERAVSAQAAGVLADPADPEQARALVERWTSSASRALAEGRAEPPRFAASPEAARANAVQAAEAMLDARHHATALRSRIGRNQGPAARRAEAVYRNLHRRGRVLEEIAEINTKAAEQRANLDAAIAQRARGRAAASARRTAMAAARGELDRLTARLIALDAEAGVGERNRPAVLERWREVRDGHDALLARAAERDSTRLAAAERSAEQAQERTRTAVLAYAAALTPRPAHPDRRTSSPARTTPRDHRGPGRGR